MENVYNDQFDQSQDEPGYRWDRIRLGRRLGGEMLGASVYVLPPGERSFPYHLHHANEELLLVLEGDLVLNDGFRLRCGGFRLRFLTSEAEQQEEEELFHGGIHLQC